MRHPWIAGLFLLVLLIAFRVLGAAFTEQLPNFNPLPAVFLCSVIFFRGAKAWMIPLVAWMLSNPLATLIQGYNPLEAPGAEITALLTVIGIGLVALPLRSKATPVTMIGASIAGALLFHFVTGVGAWLTYPLYEKSLSGLYASLWTGPVGAVLPSWVFLRNLAAANVLFTGICLLARRSPEPEAAAAALPQHR